MHIVLTLKPHHLITSHSLNYYPNNNNNAPHSPPPPPRLQNRSFRRSLPKTNRPLNRPQIPSTFFPLLPLHSYPFLLLLRRFTPPPFQMSQMSPAFGITFVVCRGPESAWHFEVDFEGQRWRKEAAPGPRRGVCGPKRKPNRPQQTARKPRLIRFLRRLLRLIRS